MKKEEKQAKGKWLGGAKWNPSPSWKDNRWSRMPGQRPHPHTPFSQWMIRRNISNRALALRVGCHWRTIARVRAGATPSHLMRRALRSSYPDCPIPVRGPQKVYERELPIPLPEHAPYIDHPAPLQRRLAYYRKQRLEARARRRAAGG